MADYKRIVSYMYDYENGTKRENIGFARVEARNEQCKIMIHIKAPSVNNQVLKVYIFYRKKGRMEPIVLGDMRIRNGMGDFRATTRFDNIMGMGIPLDEMGGIIVFYKDDKFYASEWDDEPIRISNLQRDDNKIIEKADKIEETEKIVNEIQVVEEVNVADEIKVEETEQEELENIDEKVEEDNKEEVSIVSDLDEILIEDTSEKPMEKDIEADPLCSPIATRILDKYMKMFPFEDKSIVECVRIEPQDIGSFPIEHWVLGNNSFLLHGYYNYRHLIFGRKIEDNKNKYFIGVPGVYEDREMSMAKLFGFEHFKPINEREEVNGEFGYWYQSIHL